MLATIGNAMDISFYGDGNMHETSGDEHEARRCRSADEPIKSGLKMIRGEFYEEQHHRRQQADESDELKNIRGKPKCAAFRCTICLWKVGRAVGANLIRYSIAFYQKCLAARLAVSNNGIRHHLTSASHSTAPRP